MAGERHTIALSENGEVYTFGYGKKYVNMFLKLFINLQNYMPVTEVLKLILGKFSFNLIFFY